MITLFNTEYLTNVGVVPNTSSPQLLNLSYKQTNIDMNDLFSNEFLTEYNGLIEINSTNTALILTGLTATQISVVEMLDVIYQYGLALHITPLQHNLNTPIGVVNANNSNYNVTNDNGLSKMISIYKGYYNDTITKLITFLEKNKIPYKIEEINYEEVKKTKKSFYII
jgi:hypothetical protein